MLLETYSLQDEQQMLHDKFALLDELSGFQALTEYQQSLIKLSLYIQARAERGTDDASRTAVGITESIYQNNSEELAYIYAEGHLLLQSEEGIVPNPITRGYRDCQNAIVNWYCHASVYAIESQAKLSITPYTVPRAFFSNSKYQINNYDQIKDAVKASGYPSVVHIMFADLGSKYGEYNTNHSCLALGEDKDGNIIIWEKNGFQYPFNIKALNEVYEYYKMFRIWGVRPLRDPSDALGLNLSGQTN